jgi:hypothetical protein
MQSYMKSQDEQARKERMQAVRHQESRITKDNVA